MIVNAKYRGLPISFNTENDEIITDNWLISFLVDVNLWWDFKVLRLEEIPILIKEE